MWPIWLAPINRRWRQSAYLIPWLSLLRCRANPDLSLTEARLINAGDLELVLRVADIAALVTTEERRAILEIEQSAGRQFLRLNMTAENVRRALELIIGDPLLIELFLPANSQVDEEEYSEYISWALEEYAEPEVMAGLLRGSQLRIEISATGRIVAQSGGRLQDGVVHIRIPIVQLITLRSPLVYSVTIVARGAN